MKRSMLTLLLVYGCLAGTTHAQPGGTKPWPDEQSPKDPETLFALGVFGGDALPQVDMGGESCPELVLDLSPMRIGGDSSWTAGALGLLSELGPFRLAYLEMLLRAADVGASRKEANGG